MKIRDVGWAALLVVAGCATARPEPPSKVPIHLERAAGWLRTRDAFPLAVKLPRAFRLAGPTHRLADFGGHPYEVSLGAFLGADEAVMVHGERVADSSGASNYDDLPKADWPSPAFRLRSYCVEVAAGDVAGEHDLAWLRREGWEPSGTLGTEQYLATTPDHNREAVLSLVVRGVKCADKAAVERALSALRSKVRIRPR